MAFGSSERYLSFSDEKGNGVLSGISVPRVPVTGQVDALCLRYQANRTKGYQINKERIMFIGSCLFR